MSIDWNHFTPFTALAGGVLIGLAAAMFMLLNGRIVGISGVLGGLVFGLGLMLSGMANPAKVLGFLDLADAWDPSLAFVMAAAIAVGMVAFMVTRRRMVSFLNAEMRLPSARHIDRRLLAGGMLFGIGWGIAGFCPGPGLVALGKGEVKALVFVAAMLAGMGVFELLERRRRFT